MSKTNTRIEVAWWIDWGLKRYRPTHPGCGWRSRAMFTSMALAKVATAEHREVCSK